MGNKKSKHASSSQQSDASAHPNPSTGASGLTSVAPPTPLPTSGSLQTATETKAPDSATPVAVKLSSVQLFDPDAPANADADAFRLMMEEKQQSASLLQAPKDSDVVNGGLLSPTSLARQTSVLDRNSGMLTKVPDMLGSDGLDSLPSSTGVYACGGGAIAAPSINVVGDSQVPRASKVSTLSAGNDHFAAITTRGQLYVWGSNTRSQCGTKSDTSTTSQAQCAPFELALKGQRFAQVGCGHEYTVAVTTSGKCFAWGRNDKGQCGIGTRSKTKDVEEPNLLLPLANLKVSVRFVACGVAHSLALTASGRVFAWGRNKCGQLGLGTAGKSVHTPTLVESLRGRPITTAACGETHSCVVTVSGTLYTWGGATPGPLGHGPVNIPVLAPSLVKALVDADQAVCDVQCGPNHTIALTSKGTVYTFGDADCAAALGRAMANPAVDGATPGRVSLPLLPGVQVVAVAAGLRHSVILCYGVNVGTQRTVSYALTFGEAKMGQLGLSGLAADTTVVGDPSPVTTCSPSLVAMALDDSVSDMALSVAPPAGDAEEKKNNRSQGPHAHVGAIAAGGFHSLFLLLNPDDAVRMPKLAVRPPLLRRIDSISLDIVRALVDAEHALELANYLSHRLPYVEVLNASFLVSDQRMTDKFGGLNLNTVRHFWDTALRNIRGADVVQKCILDALPRLVEQLRKVECTTREVMRVFLFLLDCPFLLDPVSMQLVLKDFVFVWATLTPFGKDTIRYWLLNIPSEHFSRVVRMFGNFLGYTVRTKGVGPLAYELISILQQLYVINESARLVPYWHFYNGDINGVVRGVLAGEYQRWLTGQGPFTFCAYPFLLDTYTKSLIIKMDAMAEQRQTVSQSLIESYYSGRHPTSYVMVVRRNNIVQDTLNNISSVSSRQLKKPLKIVFHKEDAQDAGGVRKEFFQLLIRELFNPDYGMFTVNERGIYWFNTASLENHVEYELVGLVLGLAIYNSVQIAIRFPNCLWKMLLGHPLSLTDLVQADPQLGLNLRQLLEYDGGDEEDVFGLTFEVSYETFGQMKTVELIPNGANTPVTKENKGRYVERYVQYRLIESVTNQYRAFAKGFLRVCGGPFLRLLRAEELQMIVVGSETLDFKALERATKYRGFSRTSRVVQWLWETVHSLSEQDQKRFLFFVTATERAPLLGLGNMRFQIQRAGGDTERLPVAHTCFNTLDLPAYSSKAKLARKLKIAIANAEGFGME